MKTELGLRQFPQKMKIKCRFQMKFSLSLVQTTQQIHEAMQYPYSLVSVVDQLELTHSLHSIPVQTLIFRAGLKPNL